MAHLLPRTLVRIAQRSRQSLWLRPALFAAVAIATLALAPLIAPMIPDELVRLIGLDGVYDLLRALANTLLAVAIFSLGIMASSTQAAATAATPRARPLMMNDRTAQNAISTFIGGFIFSIVGIVGLSTRYYDDASRVLLFFASCLVILALIVALIRWIDRLSSLGDVGEVIDQLEEKADAAFARLARDPYFGGQCCQAPPPYGFDIRPRVFGYLQSIDTETIGTLAGERGTVIHLLARTGDYVDSAAILLRAEGLLAEKDVDRLRDAFSIGSDRLFDDDPRYGLVVLSEVASRALSPGVNDPGTALDVIGTAVRVLAAWADRADDGAAIRHACLRVAPLPAADLLADVFRGITRDGAAQLEVQLRLQTGLATLSRHDPDRFAQACAAMADEAVARARTAMTFPSDVERLVKAASALSMDGAWRAKDGQSARAASPPHP